MYLPFVMLGYAGILCLVLAGCWLVSQAMPGLRGIRQLSWAVASAIVSVALVGLRPWAPAVLSILLGNCTLFAYFLLIYWTTTRILGERARAMPWLLGWCAAALVPISCYTFVRPDITARIVLNGSTAGLIAVITALPLLRRECPHLEPAGTAVGWAQIISALLYLERSVVSVHHPPVHFVSGDWTQTAFTYGQMLVRVATCCGVLWMAVCTHSTDLEQLAMSDSLTGLLNRRAFDDLLSRELHRRRIAGESLGLILVDIDRFKHVNDTYGHGNGDAVLRQTAKILKNGTRLGDALARYGGEEFAILLQDAGDGQVNAIAERLRADIEQAVVGPKRIRVTVSLGIAESYHAESPRDLLERCDRALYCSKNAGRNRVSASAL